MSLKRASHSLRHSANSTLFGRTSIKKSLSERHELSHLLPPEMQAQFTPITILGKGEFGIAFKVKQQDGSMVTIKRYLDNPKLKNRELSILKVMNCRYIIRLLAHFYTAGPKPHTRYVNLVTDFMPQSLYEYCEPYFQAQTSIPKIYVLLFSFQIFAGLSYLQSFRIVHRDICPKNILVDQNNGRAKICDFSSAKQMISDSEKSVPCLNSWNYKAPEIIFGSETYGLSVDIWATGCILAEMVLGRPLFQGSSPVAVLHDIVRIIGPPTKSEIRKYKGTLKVTLARQASSSLEQEFGPKHEELCQLLAAIFQWDPDKRPTASAATDFRVFDPLFRGTPVLPNGLPLPQLLRGGGLKLDRLDIIADDEVKFDEKRIFENILFSK